MGIHGRLGEEGSGLGLARQALLLVLVDELGRRGRIGAAGPDEELALPGPRREAQLGALEAIRHAQAHEAVLVVDDGALRVDRAVRDLLAVGWGEQQVDLEAGGKRTAHGLPIAHGLGPSAHGLGRIAEQEPQVKPSRRLRRGRRKTSTVVSWPGLSVTCFLRLELAELDRGRDPALDRDPLGRLERQPEARHRLALPEGVALPADRGSHPALVVDVAGDLVLRLEDDDQRRRHRCGHGTVPLMVIGVSRSITALISSSAARSSSSSGSGWSTRATGTIGSRFLVAHGRRELVNAVPPRRREIGRRPRPPRPRPPRTRGRRAARRAARTP